jgi:hypothetical protein
VSGRDAGSTTYEVTVTFLIEQPNDLGLSAGEIEDNACMAVENLGAVGYALIVPATVSVEVAEWNPDELT